MPFPRPPPQLLRQRCLFSVSHHTRRPPYQLHPHLRTLATSTSPRNNPTTPPPPSTFQKEHKTQLKARSKGSHASFSPSSALEWGGPDGEWDLIVGLEFHAQLNTTRKLFSDAKTSINEMPNTHVAVFDAALPGTQPKFQRQTLAPAIRAALALNCKVQLESRFDRKHYFYWDQPAGYQITQFYRPLAKYGSLTLLPTDTLDPLDPNSGTTLLTSPFTVGIKQIQLEQDTAKTITTPSFNFTNPSSTHLIDLNRVSHPLIEIITTPCLPTPYLCALTLRKLQAILKAIGTTIIGMEWGGLRCDVNASVKPRGKSGAGPLGLGQRVEIKNLASGRAVERAVEYEARRQVRILQSGGTVIGETRGWDETGPGENGEEGQGRTVRLRAKEGETDYRYMPDPDIPPLLITPDLINHIQQTMPMLPDQTLEMLVEEYGLTKKDANTLMAWENGERVKYYLDVVKRVRGALREEQAREESKADDDKVVTDELIQDAGRIVGNWVVHTVPAALTAATSTPQPSSLIPGLSTQPPSRPPPTPPPSPSSQTQPTSSWATKPPIYPRHLQQIITPLLLGQVTQTGSKTLLSLALQPPQPRHHDLYFIPNLIETHNLTAIGISTPELIGMTRSVVYSPEAEKMRKQYLDVVGKLEADGAERAEGGKKAAAMEKKLVGIRNWFLGRVVKELGGRVDPKRVEGAVARVLQEIWSRRR